MSSSSVSTVYARPVPLPDADSAEYWHYVAAHELRVQRCTTCQSLRWPSREICDRCGSTGHDMAKMSGSGTLVSWTLVHHATVSGFEDELPYCVVVVELDESPDLVILGSAVISKTELRVGSAVQAVFDDVTPTVTLLRWISAQPRASDAAVDIEVEVKEGTS